jgi:release factor glutamine methyltransferase
MALLHALPPPPCRSRFERLHRSIWRVRYVSYTPSRLTRAAAGSDVERDAAPLPTPLRERDASSTSSSLLVSEWRAWARDRAKATSEALPATSDLPSVESLFTEIDWIIEDAVVGQRRGSADEPPAPWSIAEMVSTSVSSTKKTDDDDDDASSAELVLRESVAGLRALWNVRLDDRVPLQYLTSTSHWRDLVLVVTPATLIPRPETERMVDFVADALRASPTLADAPWADLGTGSGALAIAVAKTLESMVTKPRATVHAVDVSPAAVAVARANAERCGVADVADVYARSASGTSSGTSSGASGASGAARVATHVGSWFEPLDALNIRGFGGIVSNPPYIPSRDITHLQPEVARHEPRLALDGGAGAGTRCVDAIVAGAATRLRRGGFLLLETNGGTQAEAIARTLREYVSADDARVFEEVAILNDYGGVNRFVSARRRE